VSYVDKRSCVSRSIKPEILSAPANIFETERSVKDGKTLGWAYDLDEYKDEPEV